MKGTDYFVCICRRQAQAQSFIHQHSFTMFSRALRPSASVFPVRRVHDNAYMLFSSVCMFSSTGPCARARCTRARSRTVRALLHQGRAHALGPCARTRIWAVLTLAPRPCAHPAPGPCARAQVLAVRSRPHQGRARSLPGARHALAPGPSGPRQSGPAEIAVLDPRTQDPERSC